MRMSAAALLLALALPADADEAASARVRRGTLVVAIAAEGQLLGEVAAEVRLDLRAGVGDPPLVGLLPAGTVVAAGDVILRLDPAAHERALEQARFDVRTARADLEIQRRRWDLERDAGRRLLRARQEALEEARAARRNWLDVERPAAEARDGLEDRGDAQALENTQSELEQLVRMYEEDELVDETEAIVLARARFDLERRLAINDLNARQRKFRAEVERPKRDEAAERGVRDREEDLEAATRDLEIGSAGREVARERAEREIEKKGRHQEEVEADLAALEVKAPAAGLLLHGALDGAPSRRYRIGQTIDRSQPVAVIVAPDRPVAHLRVPVRDALRLPAVTGVRLEFTAAGAPAAAGRIVEVDPLPSGDHLRVLVRPEGKLSGRLFGLPLSASLVLSEHADVLLVPLAAVRRSGERATCTVRGPDGKTREAEVVTGPDDGKDAIVRSGLAEGDTVLLPGDGR